MMDLTNLPHEILESIFNQLIKKRDISHCQITCHGWYKPAEHVLYREVILTHYNAALSFIQKITQTHSETGKLVKILRIFYNDLCEPTTNLNLSNDMSFKKAANHLFSNMAQYCPHLEIIDTCYNPNSLWHLLQQEFKHWKYIKEIPKISWDGGNLNTYFDTAILYRKSLQSLYVGDRNYFTGWDNGPKINYIKVFQILNEFIHLNCLELQFATTTKTVIILDTIINVCPLLTTLKFTPTFYDQSQYFEVKNPMINLLPVHLLNIQPHYRLKTFEGMGVEFTEESTLYFIYKFPKLEKLLLKQFLNQEILQQQETNQVIKLIVKHISIMKQVNVYNTLNINTMIHLMQELLKVAEHETIIQIEYDDYNDDVHQIGGLCYPYLVIKTKGIKMFLQVHFKSCKSYILPHIKLIENLYDMKELHLNLSKNLIHSNIIIEYEEEELFPKSLGRSFYQLTNCLQLQILQLKNINLYHIQEKKCKINTSVHTIYIKKDELHLIYELEDGLEKISKYFIHLENIQFDIINIMNQQSKMINIKIKLLYSNLNNISWKANNFTSLLLFVHEIMNSSKNYFLITRHNVCEISNQHFLSHFNESTLKLEVQCYSLKTFTVQYHNIYQTCIL